MEGKIRFDPSNGIRYALGCKTSFGYSFFGSGRESDRLHLTTDQPEKDAAYWLKEVPELSDRLVILELVAEKGHFDGSKFFDPNLVLGFGIDPKREVMLLALQPRFLDMEKVYDNFGKVALLLPGLEGCLHPFNFRTKVVHSYQKEVLK